MNEDEIPMETDAIALEDSDDTAVLVIYFCDCPQSLQDLHNFWTQDLLKKT